MAGAAPSRTCACRLVGDVRRRNARARDVLRSSEELSQLDRRDRDLATRLVMGVVATRGDLDARIDANLSRGRLEPRVRDAMRVSAFELLWLDTPTEVAVSQGVELVRAVAPRATGLANAVLRRVAEGRNELEEARRRTRKGVSSAEECALLAGIPSWMARSIGKSWSLQLLRDLALSHLDPAPVYVATNSALHTDDEARELLESAGLEPRETGLPGSFALEAPAGLAASGLVGGVDVLPCDLAAQMVCSIAAPAPSGTLLEIGQGRGTKTILMLASALRQGGPAHVLGTDVLPGKVRAAGERCERAGMGAWVEETAYDARWLAADDLPPQLAGLFDTVFVDAPCSGTGTMRRHPEICWELAEHAVDPTAPGSLPQLQLDILRAAVARVAPGGSLVYSTCSLLKAEDEDIVEAFLSGPEGAGFRIAPIAAAPGVSSLSEDARRQVLAHVSGNGLFRTSPQAGGPDGHFCCRFVRK